MLEVGSADGGPRDESSTRKRRAAISRFSRLIIEAEL
jgi:hypothetical protein